MMKSPAFFSPRSPRLRVKYPTLIKFLFHAEARGTRRKREGENPPAGASRQAPRTGARALETHRLSSGNPLEIPNLRDIDEMGTGKAKTMDEKWRLVETPQSLRLGSPRDEGPSWLHGRAPAPR